jgi:hypothetical protein
MESDDLSKQVIGCATTCNVSFFNPFVLFVSFVVPVTSALNQHGTTFTVIGVIRSNQRIFVHVISARTSISTA